MAWIEVHQSVWSHRHTLLLADALGLIPLFAAAHMVHLWTWALDNAAEGELTGLPTKVIAAGGGWTGDPDTFVSAVILSGYLERRGDELHLHNWDRYAGKLLDRRRQAKERMRDARSKTAAPVAERAQDAAGTDASRAQLPNPTVPDLTVPYQEEKSPPAPKADTTGQIPSRREEAPSNNAKAVVPSPAVAGSPVPSEATQEDYNVAEGALQLARAQERYSARPVPPDDLQTLKSLMRDAAENGIEWQSLLAIMADEQEVFRRTKATRTDKLIKSIKFYLPAWNSHIREARETGQGQSRAAPALVAQASRSSAAGLRSTDHIE